MKFYCSLKVLLNDLELMCLSTRDLILRCCADLAEQQAKAVGSPEHRFGELTLSVGYIKETGNIEITIFQGRNLPGLDKSGTLHTAVCARQCYTHMWLFLRSQ